MHKSAILYRILLAVGIVAGCCGARTLHPGIKNYAQWIGFGLPREESRDTSIIIRRFTEDSTVKFLAVNAQTLFTAVFDSTEMTAEPSSWSDIVSRFGSTPYVRALIAAEKRCDSLQDAGITHCPVPSDGIELTVDLCPSKKSLDRKVFKKLADVIDKEQYPIPVAISITGTWLSKHLNDFKWLAAQVDSNVLNIIWINHTYHHYSSKTLPLKKNFMLEKGVNVDKELLLLEKELIKNGSAPSVFFRFPGLVSDSTVFRTVMRFGLIPVGSDAWLAKNQEPAQGSIVLIHANGNEPRGIKKFFKLLDAKRDSISTGSWRLFDLRSTVVPGTVVGAAATPIDSAR
jgi:hypothetical protein